MTEITSIEINGKKFRSDLIDSYHDNNTGYRVYKDGWCECYGYVFISHQKYTSVELPKHFKYSTKLQDTDNTYKSNFIEVNPSHVGHSSYSTISSAWEDSNHIKIYEFDNGKYGMGMRWMAKGYLTDEEMEKYN